MYVQDTLTTLMSLVHLFPARHQDLLASFKCVHFLNNWFLIYQLVINKSGWSFVLSLWGVLRVLC